MNGRYGTFLCNNQFERENKKIENLTVSFWDEIELAHVQYVNPFYIPPHDEGTSQIIANDLCTMTSDLHIWKELHCKWLVERKPYSYDNPLYSEE